MKTPEDMPAGMNVVRDHHQALIGNERKVSSKEKKGTLRFI